jgi:uncharacterized lipoprotein
MPKLATVLPIAAIAWLLVACGSEPTCNYSKEPYMTAESVPSLTAPEGLTPPDRSASLKIPPPPADAKPVPKGKTRCLDRPPSYFGTTDKKEADKKDAEKQGDKKDK